VTEALMRCRASQRRFRNTLLFVAADEANLATAREVVAKAMAWDSIVKDSRLQQQMTNAQEADAKEKAKTHAEGAHRAVRSAWSHIFYPVKSETPGKPFDLEHTLTSSRDRAAIPVAVYEKAKAEGITLEKLGKERLWRELEPLWPKDRAYLPIAEVADWFASYVYLPRLRDRVVLENTIRESVAELDPKFGYADGYDEATGRYRNLVWAKSLSELPSANAILVCAAEARAQIERDEVRQNGSGRRPDRGSGNTNGGGEQAPTPQPPAPKKLRRFYGSVEIDMVRPIKSFETIFNAVVMELQRTNGAKVKLTLDIEAEAPEGFDENEVSIVRDNAKQLKFKAESTGFGE
jgi:hypothetical protein